MRWKSSDGPNIPSDLGRCRGRIDLGHVARGPASDMDLTFDRPPLMSVSGIPSFSGATLSRSIGASIASDGLARYRSASVLDCDQLS